MSTSAPLNRIRLLQRNPRRISVNVSYSLFQKLQALADQQGRSTSNLCAFLLESTVEDMKQPAAVQGVAPGRAGRFGA